MVTLCNGDIATTLSCLYEKDFLACAEVQRPAQGSHRSKSPEERLTYRNALFIIS